MAFYSRWRLVVSATVIVAAVVLGCVSDLATNATRLPQATPRSENTSETTVITIEETRTPETPVSAVQRSDTPSPRPYDPSGIMYRLYPGVFETPRDTLKALDEIQAADDISHRVIN